MKKFLLLLCGAFFIFGMVGSVNALTIDFEEWNLGSGQYDPPDNFVLTSQGFSFVNGPNYNSIADMHLYGPTNGFSVSSTHELATHGDLIAMESANGAFDLNFFSAGSNWVEGTLTVWGTYADSTTTSQAFALNGVRDMETFALDSTFSNLVSVNWLHSGQNLTQGLFNIDDIVVNENAPVPEPATMLLFGIGLMGLAGISRRKK